MKRHTFLRTFMLYFKSSPIRVLSVLILTLISGILPSMHILVSMKLINLISQMLQSTEMNYFSNIWILLFSWLLISVISELSINLQGTLNTIITEKFSASIMTNLSEYLSNLTDLRFYEDKDILLKVDMVREQIQVRPQNFCFNITLNLKKIINLVSLFIVLFTVDFALPFFILCSTIPAFILSQWVGKKQWKQFEQIQNTKHKMTTYIKHSLDSEKAKDNFLFDFVKNFQSFYFNLRDSYLSSIIRLSRKGLFFQIIFSLLSALFGVGLFFAMIFIVIKKHIGVGAVAGYVQAFMQTQYEIQDLATYGKWYFILIGYFENYFDILDWATKENNTSNLVESKKIILTEGIESIELKNIYFSYSNDDIYAIKNLSAYIDGRKTFAVVGENGSGKTTLIKLLLGFYLPQKGEIIINGKYNLNTLDVLAYRKHFSAVFQDFAIYSGFSVDENIFVKPNITQTEMQKRNQKIKLLSTSFADRIENRYSNTIGTQYDGEEFSGGEKQSLAFLRSFLRKSDVMFFDEPTSAIDPIHESEIIKTILEQTKGKISLIVTHRMASVKFCNEIIVLNSGEIQESGSFEKLIEQDGIFTKFYNSQRNNFIE
ncbi:MAG: ABC transporter ATP-binding protein [Spirochaetaceae bacterium]|nr:ABC transporter ATP-binding protein [Spirochaetaceae bacterium]